MKINPPELSQTWQSGSVYLLGELELEEGICMEAKETGGQLSQ